MVRHGSVAAIDWRRAQEFVDSVPQGSELGLAILDLAVSIGMDRYKLSAMGDPDAAAIGRAVARALGGSPMADGLAGARAEADYWGVGLIVNLAAMPVMVMPPERNALQRHPSFSRSALA